MTISAAIRNLPEPPAPRRRRRLAAGGGRARPRRPADPVRDHRRRGDARDARRLARARQPRAGPAGCSASPSGSRSRPAAWPIVGLLMLPWTLWEDVLRPAVDELLDLDRGRPDDRRRRGLGDRLQRRPAARARHAGLRAHPPPRARPARCRWPTRSPTASGRGRRWPMFTLVVFTLVTGVASNGSFMHAFEARGDVRRRLRRPGEHGRDDARSTTSSGRLPRRPALRDEDFAVAAASRSCRSRRRQVGTGRGRSSRTSCAGSTTPSWGTRPSTSAQGREGYGSSRDVWSAIATRPDLAVVDSTIVAAARQLQLRRCPPTSV